MADGLQLLFGPLGWVLGDQFIDVVAMLSGELADWFSLVAAAVRLLLELVPLVDELPTWTACVVAVIALRRRREKSPPGVNAGKTGWTPK